MCHSIGNGRGVEASDGETYHCMGNGREQTCWLKREWVCVGQGWALGQGGQRWARVGNDYKMRIKKKLPPGKRAEKGQIWPLMGERCKSGRRTVSKKGLRSKRRL